MFLLQPGLLAAQAQIPCTLLHIAPAISVVASSQRYYAQAARKSSSSRKRGAPAAAEHAQQSSSAAASSLHVTEAMSAAEAGKSSVNLGADSARKQGLLQDTMKRLNKTLGSGTLMRLGDQVATQLDCIPSGCLTLDVALGGGWARGRVVEVYGPEASGKTTLALHAVAEVQKAGGQAVFVDAEHAFNIHFARRLGVNVDDLIICQPSCGEDALEVVDQVLRSHAVSAVNKLGFTRCSHAVVTLNPKKPWVADQVLRSHAVDLVAVDSVAALLPRAELEGVIGDQQVASQARLMSYGLRKLAANAHRTNTTIMFINQLRHRVGIMFGNPETTAGGQALKFYASQRVDVRAKEKVKSGDGKVETGIRVKAKVVKNKVAPPYRSAEFVIAFNKGIDAGVNLLEACLAVGVVQGKGSYYYWGEQRLGQGKDNISMMLAGDPVLSQQLTSAVKSAMQAAAADGGMVAGAVSEDEGGSADEPDVDTKEQTA